MWGWLRRASGQSFLGILDFVQMFGASFALKTAMWLTVLEWRTAASTVRQLPIPRLKSCALLEQVYPRTFLAASAFTGSTGTIGF